MPLSALVLVTTSKYRTKPKNMEYDLGGNLANLFMVDHSHDVLTLNATACTESRNIHGCYGVRLRHSSPVL